MSLISSFCKNKRVDGPTPCYYPDCRCDANPPDVYMPRERDFSDVQIDKNGYFTWPNKEYGSVVVTPSKMHNTTITVPVYSKWTCTIVNGMTICPLEGQEPNWFNRLMQSVILGFTWKKD